MLELKRTGCTKFQCAHEKSSYFPIYYHLQRSWGKVIFSQARVKNSVQGGMSGQTHPGVSDTPIGADIPQEQTPPPRPEQTPLPKCRHSPREQTPPPGRHPLPEQCMLGDAGNKRGVRILLECILVSQHIAKIVTLII